MLCDGVCAEPLMLMLGRLPGTPSILGDEEQAFRSRARPAASTTEEKREFIAVINGRT